ncbi:MAG: BamA/TamA family outer membrane protein [Bacteroidota bacterium]|nr:BamA/TamA family outer membrane protein [Bacteroidota bacterium]
MNIKLAFLFVMLYFPVYSQNMDTLSTREFNIFPILTYDSDTGLGYGLKLYLVNYLRSYESFDVIAFNSSKGERWYAFNFSTLEKEIRQGKEYNLAADVSFDYDKWIKCHFYGTNKEAKLNNDEIYTKTPFEASILISRGFTNKIAVSVGSKFKNIKNSNYKPNGLLSSSSNPLDYQTVKALAFILGFKYDSRKSFINPKSGNVLEITFEEAPKFSFTDSKYFKTVVSLANYLPFFNEDFVIANRLLYNNITPVNLPVQLFPSLGGGSTLRGYNQDRLLGNAFILLNNELRFPIYKNFGGIGGVDIGNNFAPWDKFYLGFILGLRFTLTTFIVRADVGLSSEGTNIYLNFGQLF